MPPSIEEYIPLLPNAKSVSSVARSLLHPGAEGAIQLPHPSLIRFPGCQIHRTHPAQDGAKRLFVGENVLILAERGCIQVVWIVSQAIDRHDISGFEVSPRPCGAECRVMADNLDLAFGSLEDGLKSPGALVFAVEENATDQLFREC